MSKSRTNYDVGKSGFQDLKYIVTNHDVSANAQR